MTFEGSYYIFYFQLNFLTFALPSFVLNLKIPSLIIHQFLQIKFNEYVMKCLIPELLACQKHYHTEYVFDMDNFILMASRNEINWSKVELNDQHQTVTFNVSAIEVCVALESH